MNVWLASYPRSGNTFFRIILSECYGLPSTDADALPPENWGRLRRIDPSLRSGIDPGAPRFTKTHNLPGPDLEPAIYIVRDGRDALVSYVHFVLSFVKSADADTSPARRAEDLDTFRTTLRDLLLEERSPYGTWSQNVNAWLARPHTAVVRYEDLVRNPVRTVERAFDDLGLKLPQVGDSLPSFEELRALDPRFFRRGAVGENRKEFPDDLLEIFWARNGETMRRMGYAAALA